MLVGDPSLPIVSIATLSAYNQSVVKLGGALYLLGRARMYVYDKAASVVLDALWERPDFRVFFDQHGYTLSDLGSLVHKVFVPAYLRVRTSLQGGELELLEAKVTDDVLVPLHDRSNFRELWESWDQETRDVFVREQIEMGLAHEMLSHHEGLFVEAYRQAFEAYLDER